MKKIVILLFLIFLSSCTAFSAVISNDSNELNNDITQEIVINNDSDESSDDVIQDIVIKDSITILDENKLIDIAQNYMIMFTEDDIINENQIIPYKKAFKFIYYGGVYSGGGIRPELKQYYDNYLFILPSKIVDDYILSKFNTVLDRSEIDEYQAEDDTYIFHPFEGEFYYDVVIGEQINIDDNIVQFTCNLIPDEIVWGDDGMGYHYTFTIHFENGEYKYLSVIIDEINNN